VPLDDFVDVHGEQAPVFHDDTPIDDRQIHALRRAEDECCRWIVQRARIIEPIQVEADEVRALARLDRADVISSQYLRAAERGQFERFKPRQAGRITRHAL
jgi:hypothetical protein